MKAVGTIFITIVICVSAGVLWYIGQYTVSVDAVPSLQEYMASSTADTDLFASTTSMSATSTQSPLTSTQIADISIIQSPKGPIRVFVAKNSESRERGLSGYPALDTDQGMLFIFPSAAIHSFWMKDMNFPIDIIWMNSDRKIIEISENVTPESFPETFSPSSLVQFVLEVGAGEAEKHGLKIGTHLSF